MAISNQMYVRQQAAIASVKRPPARRLPEIQLLRPPTVEAVGRGNGDQRPHPVGMTRRRNGADHAAERGADDVGGLDLQVIQQRDRIVGVPIQVIGRHHRHHELAAEVAAHEPEALLERPRDRLPRGGAHEDPVEEEQRLPLSFDVVVENRRAVAHTFTSPVGISKLTDLAAMKALRAGKNISGRSM
jgi:hypothetical protein